MTTGRLIAGSTRSLRFLVMAGLLAPVAFAGSAVEPHSRANTIALAAQATHFSVTEPPGVSVSSAFNVTVTALDASNAAATGYSGTVHFTSSSNGTLPADYTFVAGDNGTHTFSVILTSLGLQTITATDTVSASINGTGITTTVLICPPGPAPYARNSGPACAGGSITLFAYGGTVFSWTGPGGFTSTQQNPTGITVPGVYGVMLTDTGPCGGTTWVFTTVVIDSALAITRQPAGQIVSPGSKATFTVAASGGDLHYQWFVRHPSNVTNPVGTDSPSFTTYPEGNAVWFVRITNACGTLDSVEAGAQVGTTRHHASH